jgi:hypothetical protein
LIALTLTKPKKLLKTEPPLTKEVLQCAINDIFGSQWADTYFEEDGLFIVPRTGIPKEQIPEYERGLTNAENLIQQRKQHADKKREDHLRRISEDTGLPVGVTPFVDTSHTPLTKSDRAKIIAASI